MPYVPSEKTPGKEDDREILVPAVRELAKAIATVSKRHGYDAAFAGELNFALTELLQEIPRALINEGIINEEIRYWIQPLFYGVLLDVALEHKRRVNTAYEAFQIVKSGDCYDTPYYTRLVEVVDETGNTVGYQEIMMKRSAETVASDVLSMRIRLDGGPSDGSR